MSNEKQEALIAAVGEAVREFQDATNLFDQAAAMRLGLNATDLMCLGVAMTHGPVTVGEVGRMVNLTRGATTTALDRVERTGYVRRIRHPEDRRSVLVEATTRGRTAAEAIWNPMVEAGRRFLSEYTVQELATVLRFLQQAKAAQVDHLPRLEAMDGH